MDLELKDHLEHTRLSPEVADLRRLLVRRQVLEASSAMDGSNFDRIVPEDLTRIYGAYDRGFFDGLLGMERLLARGATVGLRLSKRMTRLAGLTHRRYRAPDEWAFDLAFSLPLLWQSFVGEERVIRVSGRRCTDRLDALQRVFEHELLHLCEFLAYNTSSCTKARFRNFSSDLFGHTASSHSLVSARELAWRTTGVNVGGVVEFEHDGTTLTGRVMRIVKRASVLAEVTAPDGRVSVRTFYVPLGQLRLRGA